MPNFPFSFALDILVSILLVAMIVYGVILNRKLTALRSNKAELDVLIHSFNDACSRAEAGVRSLRSATEEAHRLQQYLARGQMLRDDMSFLIERGTGLADRLEGTVRTARSEVQHTQGDAGKDSQRRGAMRNAAAATPPQPSGLASGLGLRPPPASEMAGTGVGTGVGAGMGAAAIKQPTPTPGPGAGLGEGRPIFTAAGLANGLAGGASAQEEEREEVEAAPSRPAPRAGGRERASLRSEMRGGDVAAPRSRAEKELLDALRSKR